MLRPRAVQLVLDQLLQYRNPGPSSVQNLATKMLVIDTFVVRRSPEPLLKNLLALCCSARRVVPCHLQKLGLQAWGCFEDGDPMLLGTRALHIIPISIGVQQGCLLIVVSNFSLGDRVIEHLLAAFSLGVLHGDRLGPTLDIDRFVMLEEHLFGQALTDQQRRAANPPGGVYAAIGHHSCGTAP